MTRRLKRKKLKRLSVAPPELETPKFPDAPGLHAIMLEGQEYKEAMFFRPKHICDGHD